LRLPFDFVAAGCFAGADRTGDLRLERPRLRLSSSLRSREGRAALQQALELDPHYGPAWWTLGYLNAVDAHLGLSGEWNHARMQEAIAQINRGIELDPIRRPLTRRSRQPWTPVGMKRKRWQRRSMRLTSARVTPKRGFGMPTRH
jgi:hypothetical protein